MPRSKESARIAAAKKLAAKVKEKERRKKKAQSLLSRAKKAAAEDKRELKLAREQMAQMARGILEDPDYRESLVERAVDGALPPAVEVLLYHYAYGKPAEEVHVEGEVTLAALIVGVGSQDVRAIAEQARPVAAAVQELPEPKKKQIQESTQTPSLIEGTLTQASACLDDALAETVKVSGKPKKG